MTLKKLFGKQLKAIRESRGLTQQEFAELVNLQPNTVGQIEIGYRAASFETIEKIVKNLKIDYCDLFDFKELQSDERLAKTIIKLTQNLDKKSKNFVIAYLEQFNEYLKDD